MPEEGRLLGRVIELVGGDNVVVKCNNEKIRVCRFSGKIKRRMWIRVNDIVLVSPWDSRSDRPDIIWRYITAHADRLQEESLLTC